MDWKDRIQGLLLNEISEFLKRQAQAGAEMRKKAIGKKLAAGGLSTEVKRNLRKDLATKERQERKFGASADRDANQREYKANVKGQDDVDRTRDQSRIKHSAKVDVGATHDRQGRPLSTYRQGGTGRVVDTYKVDKDVAAARARKRAGEAAARERTQQLKSATDDSSKYGIRGRRIKSVIKRYKRQLGGGGVSRAEKSRLRTRYDK